MLALCLMLSATYYAQNYAGKVDAKWFYGTVILWRCNSFTTTSNKEIRRSICSASVALCVGYKQNCMGIAG